MSRLKWKMFTDEEYDEIVIFHEARYKVESQGVVLIDLEFQVMEVRGTQKVLESPRGMNPPWRRVIFSTTLRSCKTVKTLFPPQLPPQPLTQPLGR